MRISVDGLPFIREMTTPRKLLAGSQLEWLYCPYGGFPIDKITWDKDGKSTILYHCNGVKVILKFFASNDFTNYQSHKYSFCCRSIVFFTISSNMTS